MSIGSHRGIRQGRRPIQYGGGEGLGAVGGEGDNPGLVALAVADVQPPRREVAVGEVERDGLRAANAGIEQGQQQRLVATAGGRAFVAAAELGTRSR